MQAVIFYISVPFIYLIASLPFKVLYGISDYFIFPVLYHILGYRKKVVRENLANSFPERSAGEIRKIEIKFYHYLSDLFVETFKGFRITQKQLKERFSFEPLNQFLELSEENKDIVFSLGHYGNYEWGCMVWPLVTRHEIKVPFRQFSNKRFSDFFKKSRSVFGTTLFPTYATQKEILRHSGRPFALCLANDQSAQPDKAFWVRFLNQDTSFFVGTEKIARQLNIPVFYATIDCVKRGYYHVSFKLITMNPNAESEGFIMQKHAQFLEEDIKRKPEFWLWSHRRWKHKMPDGVEYGFNIAKLQ